MLQQLSIEVGSFPPSHSQFFDRNSSNATYYTPRMYHLSRNEYLAVVTDVSIGEYSCTLSYNNKVVSTALIDIRSRVVAVELSFSDCYAGAGRRRR